MFVTLQSAIEIGYKYQYLSFGLVLIGVTCVGVRGATVAVGLPACLVFKTDVKYNPDKHVMSGLSAMATSLQDTSPKEISR